MQLYRWSIHSKKNGWFIYVGGIFRTSGNVFQELLFIRVGIRIGIVYYLMQELFSFLIHDIIIWRQIID